MAAPIVRRLTDVADEAAPLDGSNDEVFFRMATLDGGEPVVFAAAAITDADEGEVTYTPIWGDTATPGLFLAEFIVHYGADASNPQTFPNEGYLLIQVSPQAGVVPVLAEPLERDLCTLSDVVRYVPAFTPNDHQTIATLRALIAAESELVLEETGREIVALGEQPQTREYVISEQAASFGRVAIDDLAELDTVEIDDEEIEAVALYGYSRTPRRAWDPITQLAFADALTAGDVISVNGTWGFPAIPAAAREATAKRVILRYLNDVADAGDHFSEAIENVNLGALFASSRDAIESLQRKTSPLVS